MRKLSLTVVFVFLVACLSFPQRSLGDSRLNVEVSSLKDIRVCSPNYLIEVPIVNIGDDRLIINRVRPACLGCIEAGLTDTRLGPGESALLLLRGKVHKEGSFEVLLFIDSNDLHQPVQQVKLQLEYSKEYYAELYWQGTEHKHVYPFASAIELEPCSVAKAKRLIVRLGPLKNQRVNKARLKSDFFRVSDISYGSSVTTLTFESQVAEPGVYYDYLRLVVNERDLITIAVQVIAIGPFHLSEHSVSFSYVSEGSIVEKNVEVLFDTPSDVWQRFLLEPPVGQERAFSIEEVLVSEAKAKLRMKIDTKFLGGKGLKMIPLYLLGNEEDERLFFNVYGYVY